MAPDSWEMKRFSSWTLFALLACALPG